MMKTTTLKYALMMFAAMAVYFIFINLIGLGDIPELRVLNIFIVIFFTIRLAKQNLKEEPEISYLSNLLSLFTANTINVALSLIGFTVYVKLIDPDYLNVLTDSMMWMPTKNLVEILIALAFEGMAGNVIVSFATMQYYKNYKSMKKTAS